MKFRVCVFLLLTISGTNKLNAQLNHTCSVNFLPLFGNSMLVLNDSIYKMENGSVIRFETVKFYVSSVELKNDEQTVWKEPSSFHLMDVSDEKSLHISLAVPEGILFNKLKFNLGIDSTTNVSGAMGGDLDPTKGMYWTWQSGYINVKLEGMISMDKLASREFQFHLGGYQAPFNSFQTISLNIKSKNVIAVYFDLRKYFEGIDLETQNHVMSPTKEAVIFSKRMANCFYSN